MDTAYLIQKYGYLILYVGGVFEGEPVALLGGYAARSQHLALPLVMLCSQLGVFTSDQFCFYFGRLFGRRLLLRWPYFARKISPFTRLIEMHRVKLTFSFQWIPGASAVVPTALGMTTMSAISYLWMDLLGSALWAIVIPALGYFYGGAAEAALGHMHGLTTMALGLAGLAAFILGKRKLARLVLHLSPEQDPVSPPEAESPATPNSNPSITIPSSSPHPQTVYHSHGPLGFHDSNRNSDLAAIQTPP